jgi:hypothetical protein
VAEDTTPTRAPLVVKAHGHYLLADVATADGSEAVTVSPAAVGDRYCWLTIAATHGDRAATAEALLDGRQVRQLLRTLARAARSLDHAPRPRRFGRREVRRAEAAFRQAEREWLDGQGVVEYEEDF